MDEDDFYIMNDLHSEEEDEASKQLSIIANQIVPKSFSEKYKQLLAVQDELKTMEDTVKSKLIDIFESIPDLKTNKVTIGDITFTYVKPTKRNTFDSKKFKEEHPKEYDKYVKASNVKSQIRTTIK